MGIGKEKVYESNQPLFRWIETSKIDRKKTQNLKKKKNLIMNLNRNVKDLVSVDSMENSFNEMNELSYEKEPVELYQKLLNLNTSNDSLSSGDDLHPNLNADISNIGNITDIRNFLNSVKKSDKVNTDALSNLAVSSLPYLKSSAKCKDACSLSSDLNSNSIWNDMLAKLNYPSNPSISDTDRNPAQALIEQIYSVPPSFIVLKPWLTEILDVYPSVQKYVNDVTENYRFTCFGDYREALRISFFLDCHLTLLKYQGLPIELACDNVLTQHLIDHLCLLLLAITKGWHIALLCFPHHRKSYDARDIKSLNTANVTSDKNSHYHESSGDLIDKLNIFVNRLSSLGINNDVILNVMSSLFKEINPS